ncbi:MAG: squalene--hopene cyclase [Gammaproteobacteria bacterium]|nr:MAG: squalene--hopene cyclase [Gammaproteobacteria bacterium]
MTLIKPETSPVVHAGPVRAWPPGLAAGIEAALGWSEANQDPAGFWCGTLESNACMEAEWLLAFHLLGYDYAHRDALVRGILQRQRSDGAWETYFDAPSGDINATVESYAALRANGISPDSDELRRARAWIQGHGGLANIRVFTRIWLAMIGEWPWRAVPNLPPEMIHMPLWTPFNIYHFASWARATIVPLAVLSARRHVKPLPPEHRLDELFPDGRENFDYSLPRRGRRLSWSGFFRTADRVLHAIQNGGWTPGRRRAVRRCVDWVIRHQDADGAWGGIQPPWIYSLLALHAEGRTLSDPVIARGLEALDKHWYYERDDARMIHASESSVWDTALTALAMLDNGLQVETSPALRRAIDWLLANEVRVRGDWSVKAPHVEPGGWAFERANLNYPDIDDTAVVLIVLARVRRQLAADSVWRGELAAAIDRGRHWMLAMQSSNGGWASFDRDNDSAVLAQIPFSDFGEALDPPSADVTAHVLEALGELGFDRTAPAVARGLAFLRREQEASGSWFGRWGVNHIYGTAAVLPALRAVGEDMRAADIRRAAAWLAARQNRDGGWGETCASYMDPAWIGRGVSTASQTGWALMGLIAVDDEAHAQVIDRGTNFLLSTQRDGTWHEREYTGTGFPGYGVGARTALDNPGLGRRLGQGAELQRAFMINYNLYRHYFPLMALGRVNARR